jgi:hypothetical protein
MVGNPLGAQGAVLAGNSDTPALGWATRERIEYQGGPHSEAVLSYPIGVCADAPPITVDFSWTDTASAKASESCPSPAYLAAFAQAVFPGDGNLLLTNFPSAHRRCGRLWRINDRRIHS